MTDMTPTLPKLPFAVFDEFGNGADDRVMEYGEQCARAAVEARTPDEKAIVEPGTWAELMLMMESSAWDGVVQLADALSNIEDFAKAATPPAVEARVPSGWPETCDGKEQEAWEAWAKSEGLSMECHPLHYLFLNATTYKARDAWKAGLRYASEQARAALSAAPAAPQAEPEQRTLEKIEQLKFDIRQAMIEYGSAYKAGHDNGIKEASGRGCRLIDELAAAALGRAVAEPGWFSVNLAEMILSDCGHSTDYTPLLNKVAARIDKHVEEILSATQPPTQQASAQGEQAQKASAQPTQAAKDVQWPKARDVGRYGDMSPSAHMRVGLDSDNDVYVSVWDENGGGSVEFCNPGGGGGGSSTKTRLALLELMCAMEADNAERSDKDWWARRRSAKAFAAMRTGEPKV